MTYDVYQITIKGHLDREWSDWFDGLTITLVDNGETILSGPVVDQTALHGMLIKIRDLGLPLLSLTRMETERESQSDINSDGTASVRFDDHAETANHASVRKSTAAVIFP